MERGTVRDIFHRSRHPYTLKLLECDPGRIAEPTRNLPTIPGELPSLVHVPQGCIFQSRCPERFDLCVRKPPPHPITPEHLSACHKAEALEPA